VRFTASRKSSWSVDFIHFARPITLKVRYSKCVNFSFTKLLLCHSAHEFDNPASSSVSQVKRLWSEKQRRKNVTTNGVPCVFKKTRAISPKTPDWFG